MSSAGAQRGFLILFSGNFLFDSLFLSFCSIFDWIYNPSRRNSLCSYPAILRSDMSFTIETLNPRYLSRIANKEIIQPIAKETIQKKKYINKYRNS